MLETVFPIWQNWETLGKHACAVKTINVSGKILPRFVDVLLKLTGRSSVPHSKVTLPETFCLYMKVIFDPLCRVTLVLGSLACK